ncbi:hypothetical protein NBRC110019_20420 [Neptunitalea chrysea]|uniref:Uncharacterized protein n=2 Tax=Neptunitalea chrysea TaxID=1647581 RepID=A0A9W6EVV8_9FLAO|nr:hypothetical protein NBRC110019_20420 [Neptunitalea chrysea]
MAKVHKIVLSLIVLIALGVTLVLLRESAKILWVTHEYIILSHFKNEKKIALNNIKGYRLTKYYICIYPTIVEEMEVLQIPKSFLKYNPDFVQWIKLNVPKV